MKSLWMLCALAAGLALGAACGPQETYCPYTGNNGVCPILGDDAHPREQDSGAGNGGGTGCPPGQHLACSGGSCVCST